MTPGDQKKERWPGRVPMAHTGGRVLHPPARSTHAMPCGARDAQGGYCYHVLNRGNARRTGRWFAVQHWGVTPDVVTVAKALGNGLPIAAYITTDAHAAKYTRPGASTFGGNLISSRAALATLKYHKSRDLGRRATKLGDHLQYRLRELADRHPAVADVRGMGLMIGVELRDSAVQTAAGLMDDLLEDLKDAGYLVGKTGPGRNVLTIMPPLIVEREALDGLVDCLDDLLMWCGG